MEELKECNYLYRVGNDEFSLYVFAETASEALKKLEEESYCVNGMLIEIVCFANEIVNYKK